MMKVRLLGLWIAVALMPAFLVGCGNKNLGQVSGTVTLDGEPLAEATLIFTPITGGRPAAARTNSQGRYELIYDREDSGAMLGEHVVEITTADELVGEDDTVEKIAEKVPTEYNLDSKLRATVKEGTQTFDFALKSGGEIMTEADSESESEGE